MFFAQNTWTRFDKVGLDATTLDGFLAATVPLRLSILV